MEVAVLVVCELLLAWSHTPMLIAVSCLRKPCTREPDPLAMTASSCGNLESN